MFHCYARTVGFTFLGFLFLASNASAGQPPLELILSDDSTILIDVNTADAFQVREVTEQGTTWTALEIPEYGFTTRIGAPRLPVLRSLIDIPRGATWSVSIESPVYREMPIVSPVLPLQPSRPKTGEPAPAFAYDATAYQQAGYLEVNPATVVEAGILRGHRLAQFSVVAADYDPARGMVRVLESARVRILLDGPKDATADQPPARLASVVLDRIVADATLNGAHNRYVPAGEIGYLVISTPGFYANADLAALLTWKVQRGFHVTHVSTNETGATKELIKAYIQNAYDTWPIPPTFVLLVGDSPDIPHWVGIGADSPATDLNYTMLAGSDYLPDLALGRLAVSDGTDLYNIVAKELNFERVEWTGNNDWEKHATFMASEDNYGVSEGTHNFVIANHLDPTGYSSDKLYVHTYNATTQQVRDAFNAGRSQGTYSGHGAETYWADGPVFYQSDVNALTNTVYPLVQSYSCLTGKFSTSECFGETWIRAEHGAVAFFGSSVTSYWTEDDILEKKLYQGFYDDQNPGEVDQTWIGGMTIYAKLKYYDYFGNVPTTRRYFEMYNILGDASVDVWTAVPISPTVDAPETLLAGQTGFEVTVAGTPNAMIAARKEEGGNDIFVSAWTDANGHATLNLGEPLAPGILNLAVTAHDCVPHFATIEVIQPSGPYLVFAGCAVHDPDGDSDFQADAGEEIDLELALENIGIDGATGVSATIASVDPYVQIATPTHDFADIPAGGVETSLEPYGIEVAGNAPDQHVVPFTVAAEANEGQWQCDFSLTVQAPILSAAGNSIDDSAPLGNGNGCADPGETFYLQLWVGNAGHSDARSLSATLACENPAVRILDASGECLHAPVGGNGLLGSFEVEILPSCPNPATLLFGASLNGANGFAAILDYEIAVGSWVDDAEADRGWSLGVPEDNATTGLWVRAEPVGTTYNGAPAQTEYDHTPDPASLCFVTGNGTPGGAAGDSDVDGGKTTLLSPTFALGDAVTATVEYWRWYTNNLGNNGGQDWWDVDATADGLNWVHLERTQSSANSWTFFSFNLGDFIPLTDLVRIRFVAADDAPGSLVEAAVDDFTLNVIRTPATDVPSAGSKLADGLITLTPNPIRGASTISYTVGQSTHVRLGLYDISGRLVWSLVDRVVGPTEHHVPLDPNEGGALPSGVYFLRFETPGLLEVRQVTVLK